MSTTYVIADGPVLDALCAALGACGLEDGDVHEAGRVVVYAHTTDPLFQRRSQHGGLRRLRRFLAYGKLTQCPVLIVGFAPKSGYGELSFLTEAAAQTGSFAQLPQKASELVELCEKAQPLAQECIRAAALSEGEDISARIRHKFIDAARPAVRVALGAYLEGDIGFEALKGCLRREWLKDTNEGGRLEELLGELGGLQLSGAQVPGQASGSEAEPGVVLLWDDDETSRESWCCVLNALFCGELKSKLGRTYRVVCNHENYYYYGMGTGANRGEPTFDSNRLRELDLVLLDYQLEDDRLGGEILYRLRKAALDLPVVIFTASDEASIAKWCLSNGADDYFVKEPPEPEDRESAKHYRWLRDTLKEALSLAGEPRYHVRNLWHRFLELRPKIAALDGLVDVHHGSVASVDWCLRQAFRFLFEPAHWTSRIYASGPREPVVYDLLACCALTDTALEALLEIGRAVAILRDPDNNLQLPERNEQATYNEWVTECITWLSERQVLCSSYGSRGWRLPQYVGHVQLRSEDLKVPSIRRVQEGLSTVLGLVDAFDFDNCGSEEPKPMENPRPSEDAPRPSGTAGGRSHGRRSVLGANDFRRQAQEEDR